MPTPACLATSVMGAPGLATNTARAEARMRWSLRAASARRPLSGDGEGVAIRLIVGMEHSVPQPRCHAIGGGGSTAILGGDGGEGRTLPLPVQPWVREHRSCGVF